MRGTVYRLIFPDGKFYIGSTIRDINERMWEHKKYAHPMNACRREQPVYLHWRNFAMDSVKIESIEEIEGSLLDIRFIEDEYIRMFKGECDCLNDTGAYFTQEEQEEWKKEYRLKNLEEMRAYDREWKRKKRAK